MFYIQIYYWRWKRTSEHLDLFTYLELQNIPTSVFHPDAFVNFFAATKQQSNFINATKEERFKNTNNRFLYHINILCAILLRIEIMTNLKLYIDRIT